MEFPISDEILKPFTSFYLSEERATSLKRAAEKELDNFSASLKNGYTVVEGLPASRQIIVARVVSSDHPLEGRTSDLVLKALKDPRSLIPFLQHTKAIEALKGMGAASPKLVAVGFWEENPAIIETFLPGMVDFPRTLVQMTVQQRADYYCALAKKMEFFYSSGVIPVDIEASNLAYRIMKDGAIAASIGDFGGSWVGSGLNAWASETDAAKQALGSFNTFVANTETALMEQGDPCIDAYGVGIVKISHLIRSQSAAGKLMSGLVERVETLFPAKSSGS